MTLSWWNTSYSIRRHIDVFNTGIDILEIGSPVYIQVDFVQLQGQDKIRDDFEDVEILYWDTSIATPAWTVLARNVEYDSDNSILSIVFNTVEGISVSDLDNYFIYMCDVTLKNQPIRPSYVSSEFNKTATPLNSGIMFTKPTEEWDNGVSMVSNAKAAFSFYGKNAKLILEYGPNRGIAEIKMNNQNPISVDTFKYYEDHATPAYITSDLPVGKHYIRLRATGEKNPSSSGETIKIVSVEYSHYTIAVLDIEEIFSTSDVITTIVGI